MAERILTERPLDLLLLIDQKLVQASGITRLIGATVLDAVSPTEVTNAAWAAQTLIIEANELAGRLARLAQRTIERERRS